MSDLLTSPDLRSPPGWGSLWSEAQVAALCDLWGSEPARLIAMRLGKTTNAVIGKANRLQLPPITQEQRHAWIRSGYAEAMKRLLSPDGEAP